MLPKTSRVTLALFLGPTLVGLLLFTYLPIVASFGLSFTRWNLLGSPQWVGLANYQKVLHDPLFWQTLGNTIGFVLFSTVGEVLLGLGLALLVALPLKRSVWFRSAYFMPFITPMVSIALVWGWLYDPQYGALIVPLRPWPKPCIGPWATLLRGYTTPERPCWRWWCCAFGSRWAIPCCYYWQACRPYRRRCTRRPIWRGLAVGKCFIM
jgi:ABC-type sugar transport system permease subunit